MARPREFDQNQVLEKAMELFWAKGYERTSIADLVAYTNVHRGSLYDTFGDKYQLFLACLNRFQQSSYKFVAERLNCPGDPKEILRLFFEQTIDWALNENEKGLKGCFMTNTAMDLAAFDANIASHVEAFNLKLESSFCDLLQRAQPNGNLASKHSVRDLARFLVNTRHGLYTMAKTATDRAALQSVSNVALSFLG
ncbi:TetR/AcrR family transcriptional regulator [Paenibacillus sp. GCM10012307]|uniref:TetR/AcrR family transcriptional regulator n=1 Tax=Paenibacillus roseus TaxID=2798579 RepID=A0A934J281_9BACL|nr:TetR/AcrR family transcriptional regulator [Paenibacillus roseus]MBJ6360108.1 TetR/AcrR family transcriptional regulator [Paenibacillus roseus]